MTLKVGIVGCGKIAGNHARALQQVPGVEVIGCCDPDLGRARSSRQRTAFPPPYVPLTNCLL